MLHLDTLEFDETIADLNPLAEYFAGRSSVRGMPPRSESLALEADVRQLQTTHSIINRGGKTYICWRDAELGTYEFQDVMAFHQFHAHRFHHVVPPGATKGSPKKVRTTDAFLESRQTRRYESIVFRPDWEASTKYWNLWKGFKTKAVAGDTAHFTTLLNALCDDQQDCVEYLLDYLAHMVQKPAELPEVAVVMRGPQGAGKGTLMKTVGSFTDNYKHLSSTRDLTGNFNGHLVDAFIVFADEAVWGGDKVAEGQLKTMITERSTYINEKHKSAVSVQNYIRLFVASNEEWAVPVGEGDRRYFVIDASSRFKGETGPGQFFHTYNKWLETGGREAVFALLMARDVSQFNPRRFPKTKARVEMMLKTLPLSSQFLYELLSGTAEVSEDTRNDIAGVNIIYRNALYQDLLAWCNERGKRYVPSADELGKAMNKAFDFAQDNPSWRSSWKDSKTGKYIYRMPSASECQRRFAANICSTEPTLVFFAYVP